METPAEFREDAPEAIAAERERRLRACRARLRPQDIFDRRKNRWSEEHVGEVRWVHALAQAGHVGAQRLLHSALADEERCEEVGHFAPDLLEILAESHPQVALALVRREGLEAAPDAAALQRWLRTMPGNCPLVADAVAEVAAIQPLDAALGEVIRGCALYAFTGRDAYNNVAMETYVADIVWLCAQKGGPAANRLAARAAELGCVAARLEYTLAGEHRLAYDNSSGPWNGDLAAAIREVRALTPLSREDKAYFRRQSDHRSMPEARPGEPMRGAFVHGIALSRVKAGDRATAERLHLRAAELGHVDAIAAHVGHGAERVLAWLAAGGTAARTIESTLRQLCALTGGGFSPAELAPKLDAMRDLLKRAPLGKLRLALCLRTGAALELGELGQPPDRERATEWYSLGMGSAPRNAKTGKMSSSFCWELATAFDPASEEHVHPEPRLAVIWYDRGIWLGGQLCLQRLLQAGAAGDLGLAPSADAALERVEAFFSEPGHRLDFQHTRPTVEALRARAKGDPVNAAKWNRAADRLAPAA